jgi:hypothetical protein
MAALAADLGVRRTLRRMEQPSFRAPYALVLIGAIIAAQGLAFLLAIRLEPPLECWVWSPEDVWCRLFPWASLALLAVVAPSGGWALARGLRPAAAALPASISVLASAIGVAAWQWLRNRLELICNAELPCTPLQQLIDYSLGVLCIALCLLLALRGFSYYRRIDPTAGGAVEQ